MEKTERGEALVGFMEFGKLANVDRVDFTLPPDAPENGRVLSYLPGVATPKAPRVLVGTAGWSNRGFVGRLYPKGARPGEFLEHYGRAFPTNELNSTYYGASAERVRRWAEAVPDGFRFCPKLPSAVTHERELHETDAEMDHFVRVIDALGDRLGRVWGVLPPAFAPAHLSVLEAFVKRWAERVPLAIELRHAGWFRDPGAGRAAFDLLASHGVVAVLTDVAGRRDVLHMRLTTPTVFLRFVGNAGHPSDEARLDEWVERVGVWVDGGVETVYIFLHQPNDPDALASSEYLLPRLSARTGVDLLAWRREHEVFQPEQLDLF